jgi:hypothetical protein
MVEWNLTQNQSYMYPPRFLIEGPTYVNAFFMEQFVSLLKQDQVIDVEWELPRVHKIKEIRSKYPTCEHQRSKIQFLLENAHMHKSLFVQVCV